MIYWLENYYIDKNYFGKFFGEFLLYYYDFFNKIRVNVLLILIIIIIVYLSVKVI